jgi:integrase
LATRPLDQLYGDLPAARFGPLALKAVRQALIGAGLARLTINQRVTLVKRLFRWAAENELVPPALYQGLQAVGGLRRGRSAAKETAPVRPVSDELVAKTLPLLNRYVRAMVELQRLTGARSGEITRLRGCDLDRSGAVWVYRPSGHKNAYRGHGREIYLGPKVQALLKDFLRPDPEAYLFSPRAATAERLA